MKRNPNLVRSPQRARRRRLFWVRFSIVLFFLLAIIFSLAILSGHERVKIQTVSVSGNSLVSTPAILATVNRDLAGRYSYLFSRSNSLIFPRLAIKQDLLTEFKTIASLDIDWVNWQTLKIQIKEREPHSIWCGEDIAIVSTDCYFVDNTGYIFSHSALETSNLFVRDYGRLATSTDIISNNFLTSERYIKIFSIIKILENNGIKVGKLYFDGVDIKLTLDTGIVFILNERVNLETAISNLFLTINKKEVVLDKNIINYIDLRLDGKVIVGKVLK